MQTILQTKIVSTALAAIAFLLSSASNEAFARRPNCYLVSVGVDDYVSANDLRGCVNDAHNATRQFRSQQGKMFGNVYTWTLTNRNASRSTIASRINYLRTRGGSGDFVVLFLSGHGGRRNGGWYFLPADYNSRNHARTSLTDHQLLSALAPLVQQGKRVMIIVDSCYAGQLAITARSYTSRYRSSTGGLMLMLSSAANQTSTALGQYSAFAKALYDGYNGNADTNRDGRITMGELRYYSQQRVNQLLSRSRRRQDTQFTWSSPLSSNTVVALVRRSSSSTGSTWVGSETLANYGRLTFRFSTGGRVTMIDARSTSNGTYTVSGNRVTLRFSSGRVVYNGTVAGQTMSGSAGNGRTSWRWSVRRQ